jgi:DNA-binding Lrp family transcriptional regulator
MFAAFLFLTTMIGSESSVLEALKTAEGVAEAHSIMGVYDIVVRVKAETMNKLKSIITKNFGGNEKITAKLAVLIREA